MRTRRLIVFIAIFQFLFLFSQNEKYKLSYVAYFLPGSKKISGKIKLNKKEIKKINENINNEKISIFINDEEYKTLKKISDSLANKNDYLSNCENKTYEIIKNNQILNLSFEAKSRIEDENIENNFAEMVVMDGIPFKFEIINKQNIVVANYKDNYFNKPYFKNLKNYYIFYNIINNTNSKRLKKFKNYFSKENFYEQILKLIAYNNCR